MKYLILILAFAQANADTIKTFRETLSALIHADTTNPPGNEARAVAIIANRLKAEKIPYEIVEFAPNRQNIIARLKGTGELRPLLLLAHLDVVGTKDQNWSVAPHEVTEKDGFLYGRGVLDDLGMAVINLETIIQLKRDKTPLKRDVIVAFTGDEESGGEGIRYTLAHRPELIDAEIAINETGGLMLGESGKVTSIKLQDAEKIYCDFILVTKGETGHSSVPKKDNAIYRLAAALDRLNKFKPEERLIPLTSEYFKSEATTGDPTMSKALLALVNAKGKLPEAALRIVRRNPQLAVMMSTTCVPTMLTGGTKLNALPAEAEANINCRILPDENPNLVKARLEKIIHDPLVEVRIGKDFSAAGPSPITGVVPSAVRDVAAELYPGVPVIPQMIMGATDSRYLRPKGIAAYGLWPIPMFEADGLRAHGIDERIPVAGILPGLEFMHRLVLKLASP